jgi:rubrerythrin
MITFNADEIFEIAEQIERNGAKFYRTAAGNAKGEVRELFIRLAEMEDDHVRIFAAMRADLAVGEISPTTFDADNQAVLYLQAMADGKIFDLKAEPSGEGAIEDVLDAAILREKDAVVFYESMKSIVPSAAGKERLAGIVQEEIGHVVDLTGQKEALTR